jgi:hypothetical protein
MGQNTMEAGRVATRFFTNNQPACLLLLFDTVLCALCDHCYRGTCAHCPPLICYQPQILALGFISSNRWKKLKGANLSGNPYSTTQLLSSILSEREDRGASDSLKRG